MHALHPVYMCLFNLTNGGYVSISAEMVNEQKYDDRSDVWALGCLIYELTTLR